MTTFEQALTRTSAYTKPIHRSIITHEQHAETNIDDVTRQYEENLHRDHGCTLDINLATKPQAVASFTLALSLASRRR